VWETHRKSIRKHRQSIAKAKEKHETHRESKGKAQAEHRESIRKTQKHIRKTREMHLKIIIKPGNQE
jgi:hypothetical protein